MIFVQQIEAVFVKRQLGGILYTCTHWFPFKTKSDD